MATIHINGTALYYEDTGSDGPPIVFSHGLLWDTSLFASQIAVLKDRFRCIAYDHRGQGKSADGTGRAIELDTLTQDAAALIEGLKLGRAHFCGHSLGGIVGMRLAIARPDLVRSLVLLSTTADAEPFKLKYKTMNVIARLFGAGSVANSVMPALYGRSTLSDPTRFLERMAWKQRLVSNRRTIWRAVNGVLERKSIHAQLRKIAAPTLVAVGDEDVATVPARAESIAAAIGGAKLVIIPRAGHGLTLEAPGAVTDLIAAFLEEQEARSVGVANAVPGKGASAVTSQHACVNGKAA
jgi:pimeloyl-ACP methyl ester carboxylesterase